MTPREILLKNALENLARESLNFVEAIRDEDCSLDSLSVHISAAITRSMALLLMIESGEV